MIKLCKLLVNIEFTPSQNNQKIQVISVKKIVKVVNLETSMLNRKRNHFIDQRDLFQRNNSVAGHVGNKMILQNRENLISLLSNRFISRK